MLSVLTYLTAPVSVCQSGPFEEYVRCGRMPQAKNHRHCKRIQMHIPQTCHSISSSSSLFDLHSLCASSAPRWAVSVSVSSMPLSAPTATAADLLSPKSSELLVYDIVLVHDRLLLPPLILLLLVLVLVLLLLHLFQCAQIESEFCCSAAPQTAVPPSATAPAPAPWQQQLQTTQQCRQANKN